jgi:very-short-patch-repair endonuclease
MGLQEAIRAAQAKQYSGKQPSSLEALFMLHLSQAPLQFMPVREYKFHKERKFAFDFAWPEQKIACEIEGGTDHRSRHTSPEGYARDCEKYNEAALLGWRVYRFTGKQVKSMQAIDFMRRVLTQ